MENIIASILLHFLSIRLPWPAASDYNGDKLFEIPFLTGSKQMAFHRFLPLVALLLSTILASNIIAAENDWVELHKPATYKNLPYRLMSPIDLDAQQKYPVIVSLHGAGGKGNDNRKQLKDWNKQLADKQLRKDYPCYVLAPQSKGLWNETQLQQIKDIIKDLPAVDMNRIYILGHSMGGHGTFIMIQIDPSYFAAAAPSAGTGLKRTEDFIDAKVIKDIPIWTFHGDKDGVCPYGKVAELFAEMKELGGNMKLTTWKGENHGVSGKFIPGAENGSTQSSSDRCDQESDFMKWLFKQVKSK
ncbi:MAG: alpha/beta hydrolase [Blastopirellula sp.]|nr:MAG: alpha/beta hydrolase [Blastopirellula sp.]